MKRHVGALIVVAGLLGSSLAVGQERASPSSRLTLAGDAGLGGLDGHAYATVQSGIDVRERALALGLFARVRFPLQDIRDEGAVRRRDWDEASDFVHILRYLHYRRSFRSFKLEAQEGEMLGLTLGHGSLVRDYSNIADPDHPHAGARFRLEASRVAVEAVLDNLVSPGVVGLRLEGVPVAAARPLRVGASVVIDPQAPVAVRRGAAGERLVDGAWNLRAETEALTLLGLDLEYALGDPERVQVTPYADLGSSLHGVGGHFGATGRFALTRGLRLGAQLEYRLSSAGYAPSHVETFYDLERYQSALSLSPPAAGVEPRLDPKLAGLEQGRYGGHGALAQVGLELRDLLKLRLGFSHRPGPDGSALWLRGSSRPHRRLDLGLLVLARGLGQPGAGSQGLAALGEARFSINQYLYALGQYSRLWSLDATTRYFSILQSFTLSLGATWSG